MNDLKVAIVGRPNVGKSTLFNRVCKSRLAIVDDMPGVTRDRNYTMCNWAGKDFILVDTGGMDTTEKKKIMVSNTLKQVKLAIDEADLIIFVVDIKDGLNPLDKEIAKVLYKSNKPVILTINKIDFNEQYDMYEFLQLGFQDTINISASHGINIGDLLDKVIGYLDFTNQTSSEDESMIKVAIIGKPNVGKSSLINNVLGENRVIVTDIPGTTRDSVHSYFKYKDQKYVLIDTAGLRKKTKVSEDVEYYSVKRTIKSIEDSDICILLLDASDEVGEQDEKIASFVEKAGKACIIAVNKWDKIEKETNTYLEFTDKIYTRIPFIKYAPVFFVSALTGLRIEKILDILPQVYTTYTSRINTSELNRAFREIIDAKKPHFSKVGRNRLMYITQAATAPPLFVISAKGKGRLFESYLRYIKNQIRDKFSLSGVPIRMKIIKESSEKE